jgi:hypothetical protein
MSEQDCPLWPDVRRLTTTTQALDARVHALELGGRHRRATARLLGVLRWALTLGRSS